MRLGLDGAAVDEQFHVGEAWALVGGREGDRLGASQRVSVVIGPVMLLACGSLTALRLIVAAEDAVFPLTGFQRAAAVVVSVRVAGRR